MFIQILPTFLAYSTVISVNQTRAKKISSYTGGVLTQGV